MLARISGGFGAFEHRDDPTCAPLPPLTSVNIHTCMPPALLAAEYLVIYVQVPKNAVVSAFSLTSATAPLLYVTAVLHITLWREDAQHVR